ncbi:hypothetical protein TRFO_10002 [Tritrichomonas foetus]|uniref:Uncharacterized protein n=1 Tax=Tritrichomonas foetus TaxID=1144522 RepID=A0A1J4JB22_9EUKA|nr:hypothetical protein TRFO_10002 [Tritrichomonas foetus]|eukprot:OHS96352.1 hypothetical protein TRFO_10002 [Tritrichomonas foetus]
MNMISSEANIFLDIYNYYLESKVNSKQYIDMFIKWRAILEKLESLSICTETKYNVNIKSQVTYADVTISALMDGLSVTLPFSKTSANPFSVNLAATVSGNENCQNLALLNGKSVVESQTNDIETIIRNEDIPENCWPITSVTYYLILFNSTYYCYFTN